MSNKKCPICFEALAKKDNSFYCNNCQTEYLEKYFDSEYVANNYQNIQKQYLVDYKPIDFGVRPSNYLEIYEQIKAKYLKPGKVGGFDYQDYINKYGVQSQTEEEAVVDKFDDISYESLSAAEKALVGKLREQIRNNPENAQEVFDLFEEEVKSNQALSSDSIRGIFCNIIHDVPEENKNTYIGFYHAISGRVKNHEQREARGRGGYALIQEAVAILNADFEIYESVLYRPKEYKSIEAKYNKALEELGTLDKYSVTSNEIDAILESFRNFASKVKTKKMIKKIKRRRFTITSIVVTIAVALILIGFIPTPVYQGIDTYYMDQLYNLANGEKQHDYSDNIFNQASEGEYYNHAYAFAGFKGLFWENCFNKKEYTIEGSVDGVPVIGITQLNYNEKLETLYLPETIQFIDKYAFSNCPNLKTVTATNDVRDDINVLPNSIRYIGNSAFEYNNLDAVLLPSDLQFVYGSSFNESTKVQYPGDSGEFDDICIGDANFNAKFDYITIYFVDVLKQDNVNEYNSNIFHSVRVKAHTSKAEFTAPSVSRYGYDLKGYSYLGKQENLLVDETLQYSGKGFNETIYLFTYYTPTVYNIKYELFDGENSSSNKTTYTIEDYVSVYEPSKVGYTFEGWYQDRHFNNPAITSFSSSTGDKTYYAKFTANEYQVSTGTHSSVVVTYDYNYSGARPTEVEYSPGDSIVYPTNPTREGYLFTGWYTESSCVNKYYFNTEINADMTLYAGWTTFNASYTGWSISGNTFTSTGHNDGSSYTLTITAPCSVNVSFNYSVSSESGYDWLIIYINGSQYDRISGSTSGRSYSGTLQAGQTVKFTYSKDGSSSSGSDRGTIYNFLMTSAESISSTATVSGSSLTVTFDQHYQVPVIQLNGREFIGYYTEEDGQGRKLTTSTGSSLKGWDIADDTEIYPYYIPIEYTITYNDNGGTTTDTKVEAYNIDSDTIALPAMSKTGYTFNGWYESETFDGEPIAQIETGTYGNIQLYAKFTPNTYNVVTNKQHVTITYDYNYSGATQNVVVYNQGDEVEYLKPTRSGYQFRGWFTDSSCTEFYDFPEEVTEDITLYAGWQSLVNSGYTYSISNPENYNSTSNAYSIYVNSGYSGYKCIHFTVNETGTYTLYYRQGTSGTSYQLNVYMYNMTTQTAVMSNRYTDYNGYYTSYTFTASAGDVIYIRTYYYSYSNYLYFYFAGFEDNTSSSTVVLNPFTGDTTSQSVTYDQPYTIEYYDLDGYKFKGYFTGQNGSGTQITDEEGNGLENWTRTTDLTVYPYYELATYSIIYNDNDGVTSDTKVPTYTIESPTFALPTMTKTGHTFNGWYTSSDFSGESYTQIELGSFGDLELYAKFTPNTYLVDNNQQDVTITYDYNYSGSTQTTVTYNPGDEVEYPTEPTRSGYQFRGWFTDLSCTEFFDFTEERNEDITLYAGWQALYSSSYSYSISSPENYYSSSTYYSTQGTSYYKYIHFTVNETGTYTLYYRQGTTGSNYKLNVYMYNMTTQTDVMSNRYTDTSGNYTSCTFTASAGDVIYIRTYIYYYNNYLYFYFSGFEQTVSSLTISDGVSVTYGEEYSLPYEEINGYNFKGYFTRENGTGIQMTDEEGNSLANWTLTNNLTVYPYYEKATYTVTYNDNGGTTTDTKVGSFQIDSETFALPTMTKVGYTFDGWYESEYFNGSAISEIETGTYENKTLYAKYTANTYTLNYPDNEIEVTYNYNYTGSTSSEVTYNVGDTISYPTNPTRSGYQFRGWFTDSSCTEFFDFTEEVNEDITLYAGWQALYSSSYTYSISNPENYNSSSPYSIQASSSYKYVHFTVNESGTFTFYYRQGSSGTNYQISVQLFNLTTQTEVMSARYTYTSNSTYTFTANAGDVIYIRLSRYNYSSNLYCYFTGFDASTSTSTVGNSVFDDLTVTYDQEYSLPVEEINGYNFKGYFTGQNGTGTQITDEEGNSLANWTLTNNLTVYPYYEKATYTVTYNDNGGTTTDTKVESFQVDSETFALPTMTKVGYTFNGWYESEDFSGSAISEIVIGTYENKTLYAKFTANTYTLTYPVDSITVTYDYNYTGSTSSEVTYNVGDTISYPTNPTRSGYIFTGWYTESSCVNKYYFNTDIDEDITLYAGWGTASKTYNSWSISGNTFTSTGHNHSSSYTLTITAPCKVNVSFNYSVSSESGYDWLTIYINGSQYDRISGSTSGRSYSGTLQAGQTVRFVYSKDGSANSGNDCGTIYNFLMTSTENITSTAEVIEGNVTVTYDAPFELSVPTQSGYTFKGYFTGENGTGTQITDELGHSLVNWNRLEDLIVYPYFE